MKKILAACIVLTFASALMAFSTWRGMNILSSTINSTTIGATTPSTGAFTSLSASAPLNVTGNSGLPTSTSGSLWIAGGFSSPSLGRFYCGDGTGWECDFVKRTGSADTILFKLKDSGQLETNSLQVDTGVSNGTGMKHFRINGGSCTTSGTQGSTCQTGALAIPGTAYADTNYTLVCETDGSITTNTATPAIQGAGSKTTSSFTLVVIQVGTSAAAFGAVDCITMHD